MTDLISDERVLLNGATLHVHFRASAPFFAAELRNSRGKVAKVAPMLMVGGEYTGAFDLRDLATGEEFDLALRAADQTLHPFGRLIAKRARSVGVAAASGARKIGASTFRRGGGQAYAALHTGQAGEGLRLRLSDADDIDRTLSAGAAPPGIARKGGGRRFSVITPVYNVEKYLDEFFRSITSQTLSFKSHIELILVDDGSTDRSPKIIRRWQKKYPENIRIFRKENGGVSSARNVGLSKASHDWLTFIDPDDFVSRDYFETVEATLRRHGEASVALISANVIDYLERTQSEVDRHPLRYRFAEGEASRPVDDLGPYYQVTVCEAFWRRDVIEQDTLRFDERIAPGSEDAHFAGRYLLRASGKVAVFQPAARYFHRRREDQSSLSQTGWTHHGTYDNELRFGHLPLLAEARARLGFVPAHIQYMVLYCISWALRRAVDHPGSVDFLTTDARQAYVDLLRQVFTYIDAEIIRAFDISFSIQHRIGVLKLFKGTEEPVDLVEIDKIDSVRRLVRVTYWSPRREPSDEFHLNGAAVEAVFRKTRVIDLLGQPFAFEHICWLPLDERARFGAAVNRRKVKILVGGRSDSADVALAGVETALAPPTRAKALQTPLVRNIRQAAASPAAVAAFGNAWLFIDRDGDADDSAEHLYRYVRERSPEINAFFILQRGSPHWSRLESDGFRLVGFNEPEHAIALLNATFLISSQADHYVTDYLGREEFGDRLKYRFVFLQHGVTQGDFSDWFNRIRLDRLISSTRPEYDAFVRDGPYRLTEKEAVLTGLPRHDALLAGPIRDGRLLVVMPTWRMSLSGPAVGAGNARSVNSTFYESEFARRWKALLHSPRLAAIADSAECRTVFVPHPNLQQYTDFFEVPGIFEVRTFGGGEPVQALFRDLSLFVTDYSSKAFDVAYLDKPIAYFQFDSDLYYRGGHTGRPGYFDFERDGFGPVCHKESELLDTIEAVLHGAAVDPVYRKRANDSFAFRDGKCCERVFDAIVALNRPATRLEPAGSSPDGERAVGG